MNRKYYFDLLKRTSRNISRKRKCHNCNQFSFTLFLQITLSGNKSDFEEFTFLSRRASWVTLKVKTVFGGSGGVGIQEIEFYNDMCKQSKLVPEIYKRTSMEQFSIECRKTKTRVIKAISLECRK